MTSSTTTQLGPVEIGFVDDLVVEVLSAVFPQIRDVTDKVAQLTDQSKEEIAMLWWGDFVSERGAHFSHGTISQANHDKIVAIWEGHTKYAGATINE